MKLLLHSGLVCFLIAAAPQLAVSGSGGDKQQELDQRCEQAREIKIGPLREQAIDECIEKKQKSPQQCRDYYKDYRGPVNRPGLFYDLPECQAAYDHRNAGGR